MRYKKHGQSMTNHAGVHRSVHRRGSAGSITSQPMGLSQPFELGRGMTPGGGNAFNFQRPAPPPIVPTGPMPGVPPGLEYLTQLDTLFVRQMVELLELVTRYETKNKYMVYDKENRPVFYAKEDSDSIQRNCCGPTREFEMEIVDATGQEVIHLSRPMACGACCFPCCLQSIEVFTPPGVLAGSVEQEWSPCISKFIIKNGEGEIVLRIKGPCCSCSCGADVNFDVLSLDGEDKVGRISKKWSGLAMENLTDADNFGVQFPKNLDVKLKAVLLGACVLIDFTYYEASANQQSSPMRHGMHGGMNRMSF